MICANCDRPMAGPVDSEFGPEYWCSHRECDAHRIAIHDILPADAIAMWREVVKAKRTVDAYDEMHDSAGNRIDVTQRPSVDYKPDCWPWLQAAFTRACCVQWWLERLGCRLLGHVHTQGRNCGRCTIRLR